MTDFRLGGSPLYTMVDPSKGSMTNRYECAKEHFKNNLKLVVPTTVTGAALGVAIASPKTAVKVGSKIGTTVAKGFKAIGARGLAAKILKNHKKFGLVGLAVAGGLWFVNSLQKHAYKSGQIDQKYTDAAAIESHTKNIVLMQTGKLKECYV